MFRHIELCKTDFGRRRTLKNLMTNAEINLGGNNQLKIYGTLQCTSGKKMKMSNRVFFASEQEAIDLGYRPCGNCMRTSYQNWKRNLFKVYQPACLNK